MNQIEQEITNQFLNDIKASEGDEKRELIYLYNEFLCGVRQRVEISNIVQIK